MLSLSEGFVGTTCYYDVSSHRLVGAEIFSDVPDYCGSTSHTKSAGQIAADSCKPTEMVERDCAIPDGGA